ncbi:MAG: asparaginase [Caldilineaceae bacterium]|nr:asparaginase [Caldilineaceae bacterium]
MNGDTRTVLVVTTGGTIDKVYFDALSEFTVGASMVGELLREAHVDAPFRIVELLRKDSLELTDEDRALIAGCVAAADETAVVITHGTDTMTVTAERLRAEPGCAGKTIVLTGALAPARFAHSDATFNVGMAFAAVQCQPPGVYLVMNGQVFTAGKVRKDRANNRFERV